MTNDPHDDCSNATNSFVTCWVDPDLNTAESLSQGKLNLNFSVDLWAMYGDSTPGNRAPSGFISDNMRQVVAGVHMPIVRKMYVTEMLINERMTYAGKCMFIKSAIEAEFKDQEISDKPDWSSIWFEYVV